MKGFGSYTASPQLELSGVEGRIVSHIAIEVRVGLISDFN